jgi:hypothetical protein
VPFPEAVGNERTDQTNHLNEHINSYGHLDQNRVAIKLLVKGVLKYGVQ